MSIDVKQYRNELRVYQDGKLALIGRIQRLFYALQGETEYIGNIDLYDLPPALFNGVFEVSVKHGRVTIQNGVWRKAMVCDNGLVQTVYNMDGKQVLERPGRSIRFVTYVPAWVNQVTQYDMSRPDTREQLLSRYAHASERYKCALEALISDTDTIVVADAGGWPGLIYKVWSAHRHGGVDQFGELVYAGVDADTLDPKQTIGNAFPNILYCGQQKEFRLSRDRRMSLA